MAKTVFGSALWFLSYKPDTDRQTDRQTGRQTDRQTDRKAKSIKELRSLIIIG